MRSGIRIFTVLFHEDMHSISPYGRSRSPTPHPPGSRSPAGEKREKDDVQRRVEWSNVEIRGERMGAWGLCSLMVKGAYCISDAGIPGLAFGMQVCRSPVPHLSTVHVLGFLYDAVPNKQALISIGNICSISCSSSNNALRERLR